jgi:hypothetical protein
MEDNGPAETSHESQSQWQLIFDTTPLFKFSGIFATNLSGAPENKGGLFGSAI